MVHRTEEWIYDNLPVISNIFLLTAFWADIKIKDYEVSIMHLMVAISSFFYHQCISVLEDHMCYNVLKFDCFMANWGLAWLLLRIVNIPHDKWSYRKYSYFLLTPYTIILMQFYHPNDYLAKMPVLYYSGVFSFCFLYIFLFWKSLPKHDWKGLGIGMSTTFFGIFFLYLADFVYDKYYIFHSIWHLFVGIGYTKALLSCEYYVFRK